MPPRCRRTRRSSRAGTSSITSSFDSNRGSGSTIRQRSGPIRSTIPPCPALASRPYSSALRSSPSTIVPRNTSRARSVAETADPTGRCDPPVLSKRSTSPSVVHPAVEERIGHERRQERIARAQLEHAAAIGAGRRHRARQGAVGLEQHALARDHAVVLPLRLGQRGHPAVAPAAQPLAVSRRRHLPPVGLRRRLRPDRLVRASAATGQRQCDAQPRPRSASASCGGPAAVHRQVSAGDRRAPRRRTGTAPAPPPAPGVTNCLVGCAASSTSFITCSRVSPRAFIVSGICPSTSDVQT